MSSGRAVRAFAKPNLSIQKLAEVIDAGPRSWPRLVEEFEQQLAEYIGVQHVVALSSGTAALHVALEAIDVKSRSVITSPFSFSSSANAVVAAGGKPKFADIELESYALDPEKVNESITGDVAAIEMVHLYGQPGDINAMLEIAEDHHIHLIEDAAQALGAEYKGKKVGSYGKVACFSTHYAKNLSTIEGGFIATEDEDIARRAKILRDHGQDRPYHQIAMGFNYRMSPLHAAMGLTEITKLDSVNDTRCSHARQYSQLLDDLTAFQVPRALPDRKHVFDEYVVRVIDRRTSRDQLLEDLNSLGIEAFVHYPTPIHLQPYYRLTYGHKSGIFPYAESAAHTVLSLPVHQDLSEQDIDFVAAELKRAASRQR
jgi:perosamine synthetase